MSSIVDEYYVSTDLAISLDLMRYCRICHGVGIKDLVVDISREKSCVIFCKCTAGILLRKVCK